MHTIDFGESFEEPTLLLLQVENTGSCFQRVNIETFSECWGYVFLMKTSVIFIRTVGKPCRPRAAVFLSDDF